MRSIHRTTLFLIPLLCGLVSTALASPAMVGLSRSSPCASCGLLDFERSLIAEDVYHYRWSLPVGAGPLDRIRIHRVVREQLPYWPIRTPHAILLTHGGRTGFDGTFLATVGPEGLDPSQNLPTFLAQRDVDVWGIDLRWTQVPWDTEDLSPLAGWGMATDAADVGKALTVARWIRRLSGNGNRKIDLLGYSWGGRVGYAYLDREAERPAGRRQVGRYVAFEGLFKTADPELRQTACELADLLQAEIDNGNVASSSQPLATVGILALTAPDDPSPILPGFSNRQAALIFGTRPAQAGLLPIHAFAGIFEEGLPVGLRFSPETAGFNLLASASGFSPTANGRDLMIVLCDDGSSNLDDRLGDVTAPVLYLGVAGGFNANGLDTFPYLGSSELESVLIAFDPPGQEALDVGHADVLMMDPADQLLWKPIFEWVTAEDL